MSRTLALLTLAALAALAFPNAAAGEDLATRQGEAGGFIRGCHDTWGVLTHETEEGLQVVFHVLATPSVSATCAGTLDSLEKSYSRDECIGDFAGSFVCGYKYHYNGYPVYELRVSGTSLRYDVGVWDGIHLSGFLGKTTIPEASGGVSCEERPRYDREVNQVCSNSDGALTACLALVTFEVGESPGVAKVGVQVSGRETGLGISPFSPGARRCDA